MEENKIIFSGALSNASHLFAGKYSKQTNQELSPYQRKLFNVALKGFQAFTTQEVARMSATDRKTIMYCYGKTKQIINELKQTMITNTISTLFGKLFPNARGSGLAFLMFPLKDARMTTRAPLYVSREALIRRLVADNILPAKEFNIAA